MTQLLNTEAYGLAVSTPEVSDMQLVDGYVSPRGCREGFVGSPAFEHGCLIIQGHYLHHRQSKKSQTDMRDASQIRHKKQHKQTINSIFTPNTIPTHTDV